MASSKRVPCACGRGNKGADQARCRLCRNERGPDKPKPVKACRFCQQPITNHRNQNGFHKSCYDGNRIECEAILSGSELAPSKLLTYEDAWRQWKHWLGVVQDRYRGPQKVDAKIRKRIVIAGDFHAPFHDSEAVAAMLDREAGADLLIIAGDLQDFYSVSRFTKYQHVPIQAELSAVAALLEQCSEHFGHVICVEGNHDQPRFERQLRDRLSLDMVQVVEFLTGGVLSPIEVMAKKFPNVTLAKRKVDDFAVRWFTQEGDLIVSHAEKFSRVPGSALRSVDEYMDDFSDTYGLKPWKVLVQAHTHQLGWIPWRADRLLVESGCLCLTHGYQLQAKIAGRPQRRGWITLEQVNGVTDLSSVRPVWFDAMRKAS